MRHPPNSEKRRFKVPGSKPDRQVIDLPLQEKIPRMAVNRGRWKTLRCDVSARVPAGGRRSQSNVSARLTQRTVRHHAAINVNQP